MIGAQLFLSWLFAPRGREGMSRYATLLFVTVVAVRSNLADQIHIGQVVSLATAEEAPREEELACGSNCGKSGTSIVGELVPHEPGKGLQLKGGALSVDKYDADLASMKAAMKTARKQLRGAATNIGATRIFDKSNSKSEEAELARLRRRNRSLKRRIRHARLLRGHKGARGVRGLPGKRGYRGYRGSRGRRGPRGLRGKRGINGRNGARGKNGKNGARGPRGFRGSLGKRGKSGKAGLRGYTGYRGKRGPGGWRGKTGKRGPKGYTGFRGKRGKKGIRGPRGFRGKPGNRGPRGIRGKVGKKGFSGRRGRRGHRGTRGHRGHFGKRGFSGFKGRTGRKGPKGLRGKIGLPGKRGPRGKPGWTGRRGHHGARGFPGKNGRNGKAGKNGKPGKAGKNGKNGRNGRQGPRGAPGRWGRRGIKGPKGYRGKPGKSGFKGFRGLRGRRGPKGAKGMPGLQGRPGLRGARYTRTRTRYGWTRHGLRRKNWLRGRIRYWRSRVHHLRRHAASQRRRHRAHARHLVRLIVHHTRINRRRGVTHISPRRSASKTALSGTVINFVNNRRVHGVSIVIRKSSASGSIVKRVTSNGNGHWSAMLAAGTYYVSSSKTGFTGVTSKIKIRSGARRQGLAAGMSPKLTGNAVRFVLRWGAHPRDLDSHLITPWRCKVIYYHKKCRTSGGLAQLDLDATRGNGPETITIPQPKKGTYNYVVKQYSRDGNIKTANARVFVFTATGVKVFKTSKATAGDRSNGVYGKDRGKRIWKVFNWKVDASGKGKVVAV